MDKLIDKFKSFWTCEKKNAVEGYVLFRDASSNRTNVMVNEGKNYWRSKWYDNKTTTFKTPSSPISDIFIKKI